MFWEDNRRPPGEVYAEGMEAFVPAPEVEIEPRSDATALPALIVTRRRERGDDGTVDVETLSDASEAVRLTRAFGMIERLRAARVGLEFDSRGVLVPTSAVGSRDWEIVPRREAEFRAAGERQRFGWTTMPTSCTSFLASAAHGRNYQVPVTFLKHGPVSDAIAEFDFRPATGVRMTGRRYPGYDGFHIAIERDGRMVDWKTYETLISARRALRLAGETVAAGRPLPEAAVLEAGELEADRAAWAVAIATAHAEGLRYTFVPLADRPPEPLPGAAVYG